MIYYGDETRSLMDLLDEVAKENEEHAILFQKYFREYKEENVAHEDYVVCLEGEASDLEDELEDVRSELYHCESEVNELEGEVARLMNILDDNEIKY